MRSSRRASYGLCLIADFQIMRKVQLRQLPGWVLFPPLKFTFQLLNLPAGVGDLSREVSRMTRTLQPVDNKTFKKLEREGVKRDTAKIILGYLFDNADCATRDDSIFSFADTSFRKMVREAGHRGSGIEWMAMLTGLEKTMDLGFPKTREFLRNRFAAENSLFKPVDKTSERSERVRRIYSENLLIEDELITAFCETVVQDKNVSRAELFSKHKEFFGKHSVDFYLWLLAHIERDIADSIYSSVSLAREEQDVIEDGAIRHFLPQIQDGKRIRCLSLLFDRWRILYSDKVLGRREAMSIREFAQKLPEPIVGNRASSKMSDDDKRNSKYRALCDWRAGKKILSDEKLEAFIGQLLPVCREREWWYWFAKIAIGLDKLHEKLAADSVYSDRELIEFFKRYKVYQSEVKKRAGA